MFDSYLEKKTQIYLSKLLFMKNLIYKLRIPKQSFKNKKEFDEQMLRE
jgi:hypothetical protein